MTANTTPIFTLTPAIGIVAISTANTTSDGTGTIGTVLTGGTDGTRITRITITATVTTTAGMVRLFINDGAANIYLWREVVVVAITKSATVAGFVYIIEFLDDRALILPAGYSLEASTHNAENFNVVAEGGNY